VRRKTLLPEKIGPLVYKLANTEEEINIARRIHHDGYLRVGYISGATPTGMVEDGYHPYSDYIIAILMNGKSKRKGEVVGVMRIIKNSPLGYPTLNEFEISKRAKDWISSIDPESIIEVGSLFVKPGYSAAKGLYRYAWQYSKIRRDTLWLACIDKTLFEVLKRRYQFYFKRIGREQFYLGSVTVPAMLDCGRQRLLMDSRLFAFYDKPQVPKSMVNILELV